MAEQRKKTASVLLSVDGNPPVSLECFPAEQWPAAGGVPGLFRVRQGGKWLRGHGGEKYHFMTPEALGGHMAQLLCGHEPAPAPDLPVGTPVRVPNGNTFAGLPLYDATRTATPPFQAADGRWHVHVLLYGRGLVAVPCDTLKHR